MRLDLFFGSQGVSALAHLVALSVSGFCASASDAAPQTDTSPDNLPALRQALSILDQLRREQHLMQEAIERLGARQDLAFDRQAKAVRQQSRDLTSSLMLQRDQEMESLHAVGRTTITAACLVAGLLLFAMGGIAWSLVRVLQRISPRVVLLPSNPNKASYLHSGEPGSSAILQTRFAAALEHLERSLLNLEAAVVRIGPDQVVTGAVRLGNTVQGTGSLPPRSQFRSMPATVAPIPAEPLPGDFL